MVKFVKLVSGDEIITDIDNDPDDENFMLLSKPMRPELSHQANGVALSFIPFIFLVEKEVFRISKDHIMLIETVIPQINDEYCKVTSTIITSPSGLVL